MAKIEGRWIKVEVTPEEFTVDTEATIHMEIMGARWAGFSPVSASVELENTDGRVYTGMAWFLQTGCLGKKTDKSNNFYTGKEPGKIIVRLEEWKGIIVARKKPIKEELSFPVE